MVPSPVLSMPNGYEPQGVPKIKNILSFFFIWRWVWLTNESAPVSNYQGSTLQ
jgi:hypothetical protein